MSFWDAVDMFRVLVYLIMLSWLVVSLLKGERQSSRRETK